MARTGFATGDAETKKLYEEKVLREQEKESFFFGGGFVGEGADNIIQLKNDLEKSRGDNSKFYLIKRLTGEARTDNQALEGYEQKLQDYNDSITLHLYRTAVRDNGELTRQRSVFEIDGLSQDALAVQGREQQDQLIFDAICTGHTKIFYGGDATTTATIEATDYITPTLLSKAKTWSKTGGNRAQNPIRPVKINGKSWYVVLVHPDVLYDMKQNAVWAQAAREALPRGYDNPLFTNADIVWDGCIVYAHENVPVFTDWGAGGNIAGCKCVLLGAQAGGWAYGKRRAYYTRATFDYENEHGYAWNLIGGTKKFQFNSLDFGAVGIYVSRTQIS